MTPSELKYQVEKHNSESHFFSRETMKFFGDTMKNYGVRSAYIVVMNSDGLPVNTEVFELYRKKQVKHGGSQSAYFRKSDFRQVWLVKGE